MSIVVRHLKTATDEEVERMVSVNGQAFEGDQFTSFILGGDLSLTADVHRAQIKAGLVGGEVYVAGFGPEDIQSVAVWFAPGRELLDTEEQKNAGFGEFMGKLKPETLKWWTEYFFPTYGALTASALGDGAKKASWHCQLLATAPDQQRKGLARALIQEVEKLAGPKGETLSTETETDVDLVIYGKLGFERRGQTHIVSPLGECEMYCLSKKATA